MRKPSVLIVDKDPHLAPMLAAALSSEFAVETLATVEAALSVSRRPTYAAFVVDVGAAPDEALRFLKEMRAGGDERVIITLSGEPRRELPALCYEQGADGHIAKTGALVRELRALTRRLLRRTASTVAKPRRRTADGIALPSRPFRLGGAIVVPKSMSLQFPRTGRRFDLSPKEFGILDFFARRKDTLVRRSEVVAHVWGPAARSGAKSIDTYLSRLRRLYRRGGADLNAVVRVKSKVGWRIRRWRAS